MRPQSRLQLDPISVYVHQADPIAQAGRPFHESSGSHIAHGWLLALDDEFSRSLDSRRDGDSFLFD